MSVGKYSPIVKYFSEDELAAAGYDQYGYSTMPNGSDGPDPMGFTEIDYLMAGSVNRSKTALQSILETGVLPDSFEVVMMYMNDRDVDYRNDFDDDF